MSSDIRSASLAELRRMDEVGELHHSRDTMPGEDLGDAFWDGAVMHPPRDKTALQLFLDPKLVAFFGRKERDAADHIETLLEAYANQQR